MSKTINNKEYRLKLFKEKIYKSTLKVQNNINNKNSNKYLKCPHCKGEEVIKYGSYNGIQRYKCKNSKCKRTFTKQTRSPFRYSKKFKENCYKYKELYERGLTIRQCADILNISIVTSFFWRHRFLYNLKQVNYIEKLYDYVELTRVVLLENFKGDRNSKNKEKGKISIVNAMNKAIDIIPIIAARNHLGFRELKENIASRIDKKAVAVAFLDGRLKAFSNKHNTINKINIRKMDITPIDAIYSGKIKIWLKKFRGVATKYIDHYLSWRANEYKNNIEYNYKLNKDQKLKLNINLDIKITTYISWNNIKGKVLSV